MSTDLQLRQELLEIRCPAITITVNLSSSSDVVNDDNTIAVIQSQESTTSDGNVLEDECQTPKSPRNMIPEILSCPPAPKKPRRVVSCKRKLCDFFEIVAREEVESFFRQFEVKPIPVILSSKGGAWRKWLSYIELNWCRLMKKNFPRPKFEWILFL